MTMRYTADPRFGHENVIEFCNRPFKSVQEMDDTLLKNMYLALVPSIRFFCGIQCLFLWSAIRKVLPRTGGLKKKSLSQQLRTLNSSRTTDDYVPDAQCLVMWLPLKWSRISQDVSVSNRHQCSPLMNNLLSCRSFQGHWPKPCHRHP